MRNRIQFSNIRTRYHLNHFHPIQNILLHCLDMMSTKIDRSQNMLYLYIVLDCCPPGSNIRLRTERIFHLSNNTLHHIPMGNCFPLRTWMMVLNNWYNKSLQVYLYRRYMNCTNYYNLTGRTHSIQCDTIRNAYNYCPMVHKNIVSDSGIEYAYHHLNTNCKYSPIDWHHVHNRTSCHWINL